MSALSADEQRMFDALVAKQNQPVVEKAFSDIGDVIRYLVANHPGFSVNPEQRQEAIDVVDATYPKATAPANEGN